LHGAAVRIHKRLPRTSVRRKSIFTLRRVSNLYSDIVTGWATAS
jgi:hypothetical protein